MNDDVARRLNKFVEGLSAEQLESFKAVQNDIVVRVEKNTASLRANTARMRDFREKLGKEEV